jgi:hypothetical protein
VSYLSVTDADREAMLAAIGVSSVEQLFQDIPAGMRYRDVLAVKPALSEAELQRHFEELAAKNVVDEICFIGAGIYDHYVTSRTPPATTGRRSPRTPASSRSTPPGARGSSSRRRRTRRCGRS